MSKERFVLLKDMAEKYGLTVVWRANDFDTVQVRDWDIARPGLQLAGYYDYFDPTRVQVMGRLETTYLEDLDPEKRQRRVDRYFSTGIRYCIIAHGLEIPPEMLSAAKRFQVSLLTTKESTSDFMARLIIGLNRELAPRTTLHGVLMEIHGEGVLITGDSGVGKSENAMSLLSRGHRLVADDAVEITCTSYGTLVGTAPDLIRYFMEIRGIGLIDARHMFGVGAVKQEQIIDLVVHFEPWDDSKFYDRLGNETEYTEILGVQVPYFVVPVRPGRNLSAILELAAMNNRARKMGYNAAQALVDRHDQLVDMG